jgi:hypothetical protein
VPDQSNENPPVPISLARSRSARKRNKALQILWGEAPIIHVEGPIYSVPSLTVGGKRYTVNVEHPQCECKDFRHTGLACIHVHAARHFISGVRWKPKSEPAIRYKNPSWYDKLKAREEPAIRQMLRCLGVATPEPERTSGPGRNRVLMGDLLVCGALAGYNNKASRFAIGDPEMLAGLCAGQVPAAYTLRAAMRRMEYNAAVRVAIDKTIECVREIEHIFAIDSTHFRTPNSEIVTQQRYGKKVIAIRSTSAKLFLAVGIKTLVAVASIVTNENESDQNQFVPLVRMFEKLFAVKIITADAGFNDQEHYEYVKALGARAFLDFDRNSKPNGSPHRDEMRAIWKNEDSPEWSEGYGLRKLVETANSVLKKRIKKVIRARSELARENEILTMVLVYNLTRLLVARKKHGIEIPFADAQAMAVIDGIETGDGDDGGEEEAA